MAGGMTEGSSPPLYRRRPGWGGGGTLLDDLLMAVPFPAGVVVAFSWGLASPSLGQQIWWAALPYPLGGHPFSLPHPPGPLPPRCACTRVSPGP